MNNNFSKDGAKWARRVEASLDTIDRNIAAASAWSDSASSSISASQERLFRLADQTKDAAQRVLERGQYLDSVLSAQAYATFGPLDNAVTAGGPVARISQLPPNSPSGKYLVNLDFSVAYCTVGVRVQGVTYAPAWSGVLHTDILLSDYGMGSSVGSFRAVWEIPSGTPIEVLQFAFDSGGVVIPRVNYLNLSVRGIL